MSRPTAHRHDYVAALAGVRTSLAELAEYGTVTITEATTALLEVDLAPAHRVLDTVARVRAGRQVLDDRLAQLLALQAPVAGDLRLLVGALRMVVALERMAELAGHVAEVVVRRHPEPVVPTDLRGAFARMGELSAQMSGQLQQTLTDDDPAPAATVEPSDAEVDANHRRVLAAVTAADSTYSARTAADVALLDRFYERFADQAVNVARGLLSLRFPVG